MKQYFCRYLVSCTKMLFLGWQLIRWNKNGDTKRYQYQSFRWNVTNSWRKSGNLCKMIFILVFCSHFNIDHSQRDLINCHSKLLLQIPLTFYLTSIYDHSIFEAFSKVVQKLIPQVSNFVGDYFDRNGYEDKLIHSHN